MGSLTEEAINPVRIIAALRTTLDYQTVKTNAISLGFGED